MINHERQKQHAYRQLEFFEKELNLPSFLREELERGQVLYSAFLSDCMFAAYRNIQDNDLIYDVISNFEAKHNAMVYHCIVSPDFLNLLYVGANEEYWEMPFFINGIVALRAAVYNRQYKFTEVGDIGLMKKTNCLVRVW